MILREASSFPTASWPPENLCHSPGGCHLIYKAMLLNKIRPQSASDVHTWVCRKLQTVQALQKKLTKDWSLWSVFQTGQSKLFSHRMILLNSAPFLQVIAWITFIFCATASWKFISRASFHHLESQKTSPARWSLHSELVYKGSGMITSD